MDDNKFIRKLSIGEFGEGFAKFFPTGEISFATVSGFPRFLTDSRDLQEKALLTAMTSGALMGMTFDVYRYDKKELDKGTPINLNRYTINNELNLSQRKLPNSEHKLSIENFLNRMKSWLKK